LERARFELPEGVHIFGAGGNAEHRPAYRRDGKPAAFVYGISYDRRAVTDNLVPGYRPAPGADFHIALLHANVDGDPDHDAYAPCRLSDLLGAGFQYWALGHIHGRRVLHEYPHVVYPGNLQGRHAGETGAKGCYIVDVDASGGLRLTFMPLDEVRWLACRVSIEGIADEERLLERMEESVYGAAASADGRSVMLEMVIGGRGPLHRRLESRNVDELLAALRERLGEPAAGDGSGWVWVHRLTVRTAPDLDLDRLAGEDSFAGEALRLARRLAADPDGREALLKEALEPMTRNARLRRLLDSRGLPSADGLLERAAARLAGMLEREED
jgi:DNA repair exonuclease SbcCD nuclease subunit